MKKKKLKRKGGEEEEARDEKKDVWREDRVGRIRSGLRRMREESGGSFHFLGSLLASWVSVLPSCRRAYSPWPRTEPCSCCLTSVTSTPHWAAKWRKARAPDPTKTPGNVPHHKFVTCSHFDAWLPSQGTAPRALCQFQVKVQHAMSKTIRSENDLWTK